MTSLKRFRRLLVAGWPILLAAALFGLVVAVFVARQRNDAIRPEFAAVAFIQVLPPEEGEVSRGRAAEQPLEEARLTAIEANADERIEPTSIVASADGEGLDFKAVARTPSEAVETAERLRQNYVDASPEALDAPFDVGDLLAEAETIEGQLSTLLPEPAPATPAPSAEESVRLSLVQGEIAALQARASQLAVELVGDLTDDEREAAADEMARIEPRLIELQAELVTIEPPPAPGQGTTTGEPVDPLAGLPLNQKWRITALQTRLQALETDYQDAFLSEAGATELVLTSASFSEITQTSIPIAVAGLGGMIGSLLLAAGLLILFDRFRRPIWTAEEVTSCPVLAEMPISTRPLSARPAAARKAGVRAIRSALLSSAAKGGVVVGMIGLESTFTDAVADLGYRLADSFTEAGSSVIVIDARSDLRAPGTGTSFEDLRGSVGQDGATVTERVERILDGLPEVAPGLSFLTGSSSAAGSADILAGKPFSQLMAQARERYDVVMIIGPSGSQAGDVAQHVDQQLIVTTRGRSTADELERMADQLRRYRLPLVATVLLTTDRKPPKAGGDDKVRAMRIGRPRLAGRRPSKVRRPVEVDAGSTE